MSKNRVIGNNNSLIWSLPNDLKRFRKLTTGNTVVMGRKTYESIGKTLPNRRNIIITRNENLSIDDDCEIVNSLEEALLLCDNNCFIIGGGEIYKQSMSLADKLYITYVDGDLEGDTKFPELGSNWVEVVKEDFNIDEKHQYNYSFVEYERYHF